LARIFLARLAYGSMEQIALSVVHVIAPGPVGGAESAVLALTAGLREQGVEAAVLALADDSSGPFIERLRAAGVPVDVVHAPGRQYLRDLKGVRAAIQARRVDVVHTHGYRADIIGMLAARGVHIASVATAHGFTGGGWKNRMNERLQLAALRRDAAVIAVSEPLAGELVRRGVRSERLIALRNAWRPPGGAWPDRQAARLMLGLPPEGRVVGWVGRMAGVKAPGAALDAFAAAGRADALLSFVGDGPDRPALQAAVERLGLSGRVRFHGMLPDAWRVLRAFDALLLSSRSEGTPMILLEAMHAGVPIVSTAVGGVPDLLDQHTARLVPWGDVPALGAAIAQVLQDPTAAAERATAARARLETNFAPDAWVARHVELYRRLVAHTP
jgi:glycosyltransferase involved in cell wall biosynthesis